MTKIGPLSSPQRTCKESVNKHLQRRLLSRGRPHLHSHMTVSRDTIKKHVEHTYTLNSAPLRFLTYTQSTVRAKTRAVRSVRFREWSLTKSLCGIKLADVTR